jgi:hypothetical protein
MLIGSAAVCRAGFVPTQTLLDAATGKDAWEGPNNQDNLGTQTGSHQENSSFSYFSGWSQSEVNCSATATASVSDAEIGLSASTTTNGYGENDTQGTGSALVDFSLPADEWLVLNYNGMGSSDQTTYTLTGPAGWTWNGMSGAEFLAPAGDYEFSVSADIQRMAGMDFASSENAVLDVVPEPMGIAIVVGLGLIRRRRVSC